ncbi:1-deoxy-D-xylulose-5-phosphate reductoisomerase [Stieleria varia]|nr:1-deoxy-D-xylulose-5-phosphate reductoisomerase [Stieleria varia]
MTPSPANRPTSTARDSLSAGDLDLQRTSCNVAVLGATGSIGTATLDVLKHLQATDSQCDWRLWAASGHTNVDKLARELVAMGSPDTRLVMSEPEAAACWQSAHAERDSEPKHQVLTGPDALVKVASEPAVDTVVAAIVGRAGLESTLAAIEHGKRVALANKETLVVAGSLVAESLNEGRKSASGAEILPVDSEHSAIFQCIASHPSAVKKLILTASGGPFREATVQQMRDATPESALAHPTWDMGRKISIDSATMMNKALEIIEARWLFDLPAEAIEVVVHPQSIIHSMVEFTDGSVIAQLSPPDMRMPIQLALTHPRRLPGIAPSLDRAQRWDLQLMPADLERFPALRLGFEVARVGGTAGAVVNAANECAVALFLDGQIRFTDIAQVCQTVLNHHNFESTPTLSRLLELDRWARDEAQRCCAAST